VVVAEGAGGECGRLAAAAVGLGVAADGIHGFRPGDSAEDSFLIPNLSVWFGHNSSAIELGVGGGKEMFVLCGLGSYAQQRGLTRFQDG
jgi:hypothetical protein